MSGEIHSGVQDIVLPNSNEIIKSLDKESEVHIKGDADDITAKKLNSLSVQESTINSEESLCCEVCNIRVTSSKILQRHLEGRRHISRSERRGKIFQCELCDVTANSEIQLNIHLSSSKHKSRVAREEYKEFTDISSFSISMYVLLFCVFCIVLNLVILVKVAF